ncbi:MAG TPA: SpoVR family protein [Planctomycetaceae bacterium]|nr:SpoVR family protein [Planctomycetaceae bacterium]
MPISTHRPLPAHIRGLQDELAERARSYGLDFFETIYEMVDYEEMSMLAAYGGFPIRYPHWRFGAEFDELMKGYSYGLQKIYEMVINTDPCYAYLLTSNEVTDQKLVIAHVYGHCDFFKNNAWFSKTNRKMLDQMANHAARVHRYVDKHGYEAVEEFIDACLSLDDLIDPHSPFIKRTETKPKRRIDGRDEKPPVDDERASGRFPSKGYMDSFINPPAVLEREAGDRDRKEREKEESRSFPEAPQRDVLMFLLEHAPLKPWQHDVLSIIRDEAYYFAPQGQTKIMNEGWACVAGDTPVYTEQGLIPMADLVAGAAETICDGEQPRRVYDRNIIRQHETVRVTTRRGLSLCGSTNHRVLLADDETWRRLDELRPGDRLSVSGGHDLWATEPVELTWSPKHGVSLEEVADEAGVSVWTVLRHRAGRRIRAAEAVGAALATYDAPENLALPRSMTKRAAVRVPTQLDESLAALVGYLVGDGHISRVKRHLGLTTGDPEQAERFADLVEELFGLEARVRQDGGRIRVLAHSETISDFLVEALGLTVGRSAAEKRMPDAVLRSPEPTVRAFLRAYFDCDGHAGRQGVILSTRSDVLAAQVQLVLLNYGILSRRRRQPDGCWHVHIAGASAAVFAERIAFGLARKQRALESYVADRRWMKQETWDDEVVSLERGREDVYDISVAETHRYAAGGLVNHNSYWHSTIMTRHALTDAEFICYADHHSGTMATSPHRLNPYKLGIELFRDIEERWDKGQFGPEWDDCDDIKAKEKWDRQLGLGRRKIFEVRRIHNDVTFIDTFLTPEFCHKHKMFSFAYNDATNYYEIASREFEEIKQQLLNGLTNHGRPFIYVVDGNYRNRGELYLMHRYQGIELKLDYARDTLMNLEKLWSRPVHVESVIDDVPTVLSYDGRSHEMKAKG